MAMRRLWFLNFDADDELAHPVGYAPSQALVARFGPLAARLAGLVPPQDAVIEEWNENVPIPSGTFEGRAFCPTPRALRALSSAAAATGPVPPLEVLQRVNHRAFSADLGQTLPGARFVRTWEELEDALRFSSGPWVLKRAFGFAGRGRQRLRSNLIEPALEPFARASIEFGGGLQVEPWVERVLDVGLHGFVAPDGAVITGDLTRQEIDDMGAWVTSSRLAGGALTPTEERSIRQEAERAAEALHRAGYFGPFGIDAFRWKLANGAPRFNARSEINARYSMGWAVGMGHRRPDLLPQLSEKR